MARYRYCWMGTRAFGCPFTALIQMSFMCLWFLQLNCLILCSAKMSDRTLDVCVYCVYVFIYVGMYVKIIATAPVSICEKCWNGHPFLQSSVLELDGNWNSTDSCPRISLLFLCICIFMFSENMWWISFLGYDWLLSVFYGLSVSYWPFLCVCYSPWTTASN